MRILQLTPRIAWPPTDGGQVVMLQIARALHRHGAELHILSLNPLAHHVDLGAARAALSPLPLDAVDIDTSSHFTALARSFTLRAPQLVSRFFSPRFEMELRKLLRSRSFDVVQIESPFLLPNARTIRENSSALIALRSLNVEFIIWERLASNERHLGRRAAFQVIARSLRRYELQQLNACDALIPITAIDAEHFRALGCTLPMYVLPGGVEPSELGMPRYDGNPNQVGFLASLDYRPNQEAAMWIADALRPRLDPGIEVHVAGRRAPAALQRRLRASGVIVSGEVDDAAAFIRGMRVMIAPILSGGGMRIKILEAMAAGKAVVSTTLGAEGIEVTNGENILIADDADSFSETIHALLRDAARASAIGRAARALVATRYSVDSLADGLLSFYEQLSERRRVGTRG